MAAVSAVTSDDNPWEFSVRLDSERWGIYDTPAYLDTSSREIGSNRSLSSNSSNHRPLAVQDPNVLNGQHSTAARNGRLSRKASDLGESDGSGELSKSRSRARSNTANDSRKMRKSSAQRSAVSRAEEEQYWIHRDKLAQIEQHELEVAGFRVSGAAGAISGIHSDRRGHDIAPSDYDPDSYTVDLDRAHQQKFGTTMHLDDEQTDYMNYELRRPEEVAAENLPPYAGPPPRYNGSKLPIKKSGAFASIASEDRDVFSTPRSRNVSGQHTGIPLPRARSRSVASATGTIPQTPPHLSSSATPSASDQSESPPLAPLKVSGKTVATSRNTSNTRAVSTAKSRTASTTTKGESPPKRPGTSSGLGGRPSTSQCPQGEAPWIPTMYKPDPRLPPDQQLLPTHARRLAQEQWEKEGRIGNVYDKNFNILHPGDFTNPYAENGAIQPTEQNSPVKDYLNVDFNTNASPTKLTSLPSPKGNTYELPLGSPRSQSSGNRPGTSGTDHGGYKTIPTIHGPPTPRSSVAPKPTEPIRTQDFDEDPGTKKGCCCIIM